MSRRLDATVSAMRRALLAEDQLYMANGTNGIQWGPKSAKRLGVTRTCLGLPVGSRKSCRLRDSARATAKEAAEGREFGCHSEKVA